MGAKFRRETAASALGEDEEEIDSTLYSEIDGIPQDERV